MKEIGKRLTLVCRPITTVFVVERGQMARSL